MFSSLVNYIFGKNNETEVKPEEKVIISLPKYESTEEIVKKKILTILPKDNWSFSKDFFVASDKTIKTKFLSKLPIQVLGGHTQKKTTIEVIMRQFIEDKLSKRSQAYRASNSNLANEAEFLLQEEKKMPHKIDAMKVFEALANKRETYKCHSGYLPKDVQRDVPNGNYFNKKCLNRKRNMSELGKYLLNIGISGNKEGTRRSKGGETCSEVNGLFMNFIISDGSKSSSSRVSSAKVFKSEQK
jgi:hypothetical protein